MVDFRRLPPLWPRSTMERALNFLRYSTSPDSLAARFAGLAFSMEDASKSMIAFNAVYRDIAKKRAQINASLTRLQEGC